MAIIRAPKKSKWYVVWIGNAPGIYPSWEKCRPQVEGFPGSKFRAYDTLAEARAAFEGGPPRSSAQRAEAAKNASSPLPSTATATPAKRGPIVPSICVDAACNMETRVMEYRGVDTQTGEVLFQMGPYEGATNNMGEFLALVHAVSMLVKENKVTPVYSDSITALAWVRNKHAKTTVAPTRANKKVFELIARAEEWLKANTVPFRTLKWETTKWGENPADFGRK